MSFVFGPASFQDYLYWKRVARLVKTLPSADAFHISYNARVSIDTVLTALLDAFSDVYRVKRSVILVLHDHFVLEVEASYTSHDTNRYDLHGVGDLTAVRAWAERFFAGITVPESRTVTWAYLVKGEVECTRMAIKPAPTLFPELYPYITDVAGLVQRFHDSRAPILVLSGEPGTGKTTLVRYMIERFKWSALTTYDPEVMRMDDFYLQFLRDNYNCALLEDADIVLSDRVASGNALMSRILNVADGLVDLTGKKIIFTANLRAVSDIDEAVLRPGRCFGIVQFRRLTPKEAAKAATAMGVVLPPGDDMSIGDIVSDGIGATLPRFGVAP